MSEDKYQEFLETQKQRYDSWFSGNALREGGSKPSKIVLNPIGEYIIALKHPSHINEKIARFVERINEEIPSVKYSEHDLHTSITTYGQTPVKSISDFQPDKKLLEKLVASTSGVKDLSGPSIIYEGWGFNADTVIVKGVPSYHFLDISQKVVEKGKKQGLELRMPWGSHITATRFSEELSPEELKGFLN
jgi:hypothetical protein